MDRAGASKPLAAIIAGLPLRFMPAAHRNAPTENGAVPPGASQTTLAAPPVHWLMSRFDIATSLMTIIPILILIYLITVRFFSISIIEGLNGFYLLLACLAALVGMIAGRQLIKDIIRQLVNVNQKLAKLYDQQAAFVSNVAHELRSPLTVFKGSLENLADGLHGPLTKGQAEPVQMCQEEVKRLQRLVGDLLDLSRIEAGKLRLARQPVALQDVLRSVTQLFAGLLKERGLDLSLELPEAVALVLGDRDRLHQVFVNLLGNAVKFTHVGGVQIRLRRNDDSHLVEIEDSGPGVREEDLERIFDKFERVGTQTEEGSGLGLPIARDIVGLHGGRIWVESQPGHGSRFFVRLPMAKPAATPAAGGS